MSDPTKDEMLRYLHAQFRGECDTFDCECAIYWFAYSWHGGQWSNLYSVLSTSDYRPGAMENGPEADSMAAMMLQSLEEEFGNVS